MVYSESLAERIRSVLAGKRGIRELKMFGGLCFLLNGNMLVGAWSVFLIARLGPEQSAAALREPHVRKMDITGKPLKSLVMVEPEGIEGDDQLRDWIERAACFVGKLPVK